MGLVNKNQGIRTMEASNFEESNHVLDKPKDMGYEDCDCLSVWMGPQSNGVPVVISCWKLTKEELEEVNKTGRVYLGVLGETMPPVWLAGKNPFKQG